MVAAQNTIVLALMETCKCCSFKISEFMTFPFSRPGTYSLLHLTKSVKTRVNVNSKPMSSILPDNSHQIVQCLMFPDNYYRTVLNSIQGLIPTSMSCYLI